MIAAPPSPAIVIAGPTASGKSGLALRLAEEFDGVIINADSMQVYDILRVVTARPGPDDEARVPHRLYGILPPSEACSAARWGALAAAEMDAAWAAGKLPILVGGTGLYLRTLMEGLSPIPEIPDAIRQEARGQLASLGNEAFHAMLTMRDPVMGARLAVGDSQRMVRALEVLNATGRSLSQWQAEPRTGAVAARWATIALLPPRDDLYRSCDSRFGRMVEEGALDEVRRLMAMNLDPALPATRALGVPELAAHLRGELSLDQAIEAGRQSTRNYAKRQMTWFRHQLNASHVLHAQFSESLTPQIFPFIRPFLLTTV